MSKEFKPFDRVIVRNNDDGLWAVVLCSHECTLGRHEICGGFRYYQCLPYEGNEELVGTDKTPKPKRWRAEMGGYYWYIGTDAVAVNDTDEGHYSENVRYSVGNYFRTAEEAEAAAEKFKKILNDEA